MKKNIFLFLFFYCMATSLYAQQRLSLPDVDAIGYSANGSWIDLYKKVGTDRYAQRRLQIDRKKIRISKASAAYQMVWDLYSCNDTLSRNDIEKARERFVDVDNLRPIALENYVGKTFDIKEGGKSRLGYNLAWGVSTIKSACFGNERREDGFVIRL